MENAITGEQITESIKRFVELSEVFYVDAEGFIKYKRDDTPVGVETGGKKLPLMVYKENARVGDWVALNPYTESLSASTSERKWFFDMLNRTIGCKTYRIVRAVVETILKHKESPDDQPPLSQVEMISTYQDKVDKTTLKEMEHLFDLEWINIFYHRGTKVAQLQSDIWDAECRKTFGTKIRQKTWEFLNSITLELLQMTSVEDAHSIYKYKAQIIGCPEADTFFHVLVKVLEAYYEPCKIWLDNMMPVAEIMKDLEYLEHFHKITAWIGTSTVSKSSAKSVEAAPWQQNPNVVQPLPANTLVSPFELSSGCLGNIMQPQAQQQQVIRANPGVIVNQQVPMAMMQPAINPYGMQNQAYPMQGYVPQQQYYGQQQGYMPQQQGYMQPMGGLVAAYQ